MPLDHSNRSARDSRRLTLPCMQRTPCGIAIDFACLYRSYRQKVHTEVKRFTRGGIPADDIVQDIFLVIWRKREELASIKNFDDWFHIITRNKIIDHQRKINKEQKIRIKFAGSQGDQENPVSRLLLSEYQQIIALTIQKLPARQQTIYQLVEQKGWRVSEVAETLKLQIGTVKSHLHRARQTVQQNLDTRLDLF
jgi:RNA polymerase sigma-19 factor, ECF subfamily